MAAQLKAAGKALLNSPKAIRRKLTGNDVSSHHGKLDDDWYHSDDPIKSGVSFYVKYLGATEVTKTHGPGSTDNAVKSIVHHAKQRGGKLQKVQIQISSKFLKIQDIINNIKLEDIPLYRVSYCTVDPYYDKVFCYISRNSETKNLECHAFLCTKKSKAEAITLTVAQAFNIAFERWQSQKKRKKEARQKQTETETASARANNGANETVVSNGSPTKDVSIGEELKTSQKLSPLHHQITAPPVALLPPPTVIEPTHQSSPTHQPSPLTQANHGVAGLSLDNNYSKKNVSSNPFLSQDDSYLDSTSSGLLEVKPTMTKAVSLDYLQVDDEFDHEFTKLAEARSNPHLLDIGDHMNRSTSKDEVQQLMIGGETNSAVQDLSKTKSIDDLLML